MGLRERSWLNMRGKVELFEHTPGVRVRRRDDRRCVAEVGRAPDLTPEIRPFPNGIVTKERSRMYEQKGGTRSGACVNARRILWTWKTEFNSRRLYSSLGYLTPHEFGRQWRAASLSETKQFGVE